MSGAKLKKVALYANLEQEEFKMIEKSVRHNNMVTLSRASLATSIVLLILVGASMMIPSLHKNQMLYFMTFVCSVVVYGIVKMLLGKKEYLATLLAYVFLFIAFFFAIVLGVPLMQDNTATTVLVLLFALPLLIVDCPLRMDLFLLGVTMLLCTWSVAIKAPEVAALDVTNGISFLLLSIVVNYLITKTKYQDILMQSMAINTYQKHLDATFKSNKNTIATFHMNLSKNRCGEGSSRYANLLNLEEDKTVDSFFEHAAEEIPDEKERKQYQDFFNRENLLAEFVHANEYVQMEHHYVLDEDKSRWIKTSVDMMLNPYTKDVEAVLYVYNINGEKVSNAIIAEVAALDYDVIAFVYEEPKHYIYVDRSNPNKSTEGVDFYLDARADVIREQPDNLAEILPRITKEAIHEALEKEHIYTIFYTAHLEDGKQARKRVRFINYNEHEKIMFVNKRDVTDVYELEEKGKEELAKALEKASAAKTEFLSNMSHDMCTPMNGILGIANLMMEKTDLKEIRKDIEQIQLSGQYLLRLINDTLDMNKIEAGKLELNITPIHSEEVFQNVFTQACLLARDKGIAMRVETPGIEHGKWVPVLADQSRLEQIFLNIISNSVKYTPSGGLIEIIMNNLSTTTEEVVDQYVIRDNGIDRKSVV